MLKSKRKMLIVLISTMLVFVLAFSLFISSCKRKSTPIEKDKKLVGFDVELAQAVSKELGMHFHSKEIVWKNKIIDVTSNTIDAIWNGMTLTEDLQKNKDLIFSQPYLKNEQVIIVNNEIAGELKSIEDLAKNNRKIAVEIGSAAEKMLKKLGLENKLEGFESQSAAILTARSQNNIAVVDALYGEFLINNENSEFKGKMKVVNVKGFNPDQEKYAIGFSKLNEYLKYRVDKALFNLQEKGKIKEIAKKYGVETRLTKIVDPGEKSEKDFNKKSVKRFKELKKDGFFIGYTLYEPIAYLVKK